MPEYHWTLSITTSSPGLTSQHIDIARDYLDDKCEYAYVVNEFGTNQDNSHLQCVVSFKTKKQSNVMDKMKILYRLMDLEIVNRHTVVVKHATHMDGALHYISKELVASKKGRVILRKGWRQGWIDNQVKEYAKKTPKAELQSLGKRFTQTTAPGAIFKWASANNMHVSNKQEFLEVGKMMAGEGYLFGTCNVKGLFMDVCALFGDGQATKDVWESALAFVAD